MGQIQLLAPELVNRIAAGECVERPASVVKELVENALDAGATRIDVAIRDGGRELIQVADDGVGMDRDDLRLCVQPHATSKIRSDDDLFNIHTMGFRGEALPSIGSVSRLRITSRPRDADVAFTIVNEGGRVGDPTPCGAPTGATVEVRDLFYNVPARRKFLKTSPTEMGQITEQFARIALAHPAIAFSLRHNNRVTHTLPATDDRRQRIRDFYGPELADALLPVRREGDGVSVNGYVCPPSESRGSGKWEYVFVNGRCIRDRFVSHAVREAYRSLIDPSRYPVAFLFITIEPALVDVNVHPSKVEVRWRDSNYIHGQVLAALRDKFLSTNLQHTLRTPAGDEQYRESVRQAMVDFFTRTGGRTATPEPTRATPLPPARPDAASRERPADAPGAPFGPHPQPAASPAAVTQAAVPDMADRPAAAASGATAEAPGLGPELRARPRAIQVHDAFIVAETDDGLQIIDQHALHERILYEQFRARISDRPLESQRMLLPDIISVPADRLDVLETHADLLARLGIELTQAGPQSVALNAFPSFLERADRQRFIRDLLDLLAESGARPSPETLLHEVLDMMACKAAVKAGDALTSEEVDELLRLRHLADRSSHCPHGRPTTLNLTLRDLERQFKRR